MRNLLDRGDSHTPSGKVAQLKTTTQSLPYLITTHRGRAFEHVNKNFRSSIAKKLKMEGAVKVKLSTQNRCQKLLNWDHRDERIKKLDFIDVAVHRYITLYLA